MSLPDGVSTCLLTYGPITDTFGTVATSIEMSIVADRTIVHAASGRTLFQNPLVVTAVDGGIIQVAVPHTNQSGFRDLAQNALTGWYYTVNLTARFGDGRQSDRKLFQPLVGQTTIDADLLASGGVVTPGVTVETGYVTSVAGLTEEVSAEDLSAALSATLDTGEVTIVEDDAIFTAQRIGSIVYYNLLGDFTEHEGHPLTGVTVPVGLRPASANGLSIPCRTGLGVAVTVLVSSAGAVDYITDDAEFNGTLQGSGSCPAAGDFPTDPF